MKVLHFRNLNNTFQVTKLVINKRNYNKKNGKKL